MDAGKRCVILYCGDHDRAGLNISACLRKNLSELLSHAEWLPLMDHLTLDRFGSQPDFMLHNLSWIDNLGTDLQEPRGPGSTKITAPTMSKAIFGSSDLARSRPMLWWSGRTLAASSVGKQS